MSITDELREYANDAVKRDDYMGGLSFDLMRIADRIDAEHEKVMAAAALIAGVPMTDEHMAEHGWIRLPLDADGVPIHVGDVVEYADNPTELFTASYIELEKNGWWVFGGVMGRRPDKYRHHHEPTVEDVLTEFFSRYVTTKPKDEDDAIVAEYAAKLRLAGDGE